MTVTNKFIVLSACALIAVLSGYTLFTDRASAQDSALSSTTEANKSFPAFDLQIPGAESDKTYLGLSGSGTFHIGQIRAKVVIIEVFSHYCPHCQRAAPGVNKLYQLIQDNPTTRMDMKLIGVGAGNSTYEVNAFKEKYNIPFPLFADPEFEITNLLGAKFTPTFIGVRLPGSSGPERFYFKDGGLQDPQQFLSEMLTLSGLE